MTFDRRQKRPLSAASAGLALLFAGSLHGQANRDPAMARVLFSEARKLAAQGSYEQACPKFEESLRNDFGIGTQFNLADCWEHVGRTASAWAAFLDVAAGARAAGQADREQVARTRAGALEPKLSRMIIQIGAPTPGLEVKRDGQAVGQGAWGTAVPVDPGAHVISAASPGKKPWSNRITVAAGAHVTVAIPPLDEQPAGTTSAPVSATEASGGAGAGTSASPSADNVAPTGQLQRTIGIVVGGIGVVGLAAGTVFWINYNSKNEEASNVCRETPTNCPATDLQRNSDLKEQAQSNLTLSYVGFGVGGAALVGGAVLYLTAPSGAARNGWRAAPLVGRGAYGASLHLTW